ncbi:12853_t:CDS:1, partial [Racocetra persica]
RFNRKFTNEKLTLLFHVGEIQLTTNEEQQLNQILAKSFDLLNADFDHQQAIANLHANFESKVALCLDCLFAKYISELEPNQ